MPDPINVPGAPVPVIPKTAAQQKRTAGATFILVLGIVATAVQSAAPQILAAWPNCKWLPALLAAVGGVWLFVQRATDVGKVTDVNLSPPGDGGS